MPATTAKGYPYPLGTDPVADGDDAIKNLAQAIDTSLGRNAAGLATTPASTALNAPVSVAVTFPVGRFTAAPLVAITPQGANPAWSTSVTSATTAGCTLNAAKVYGGNSTVTLQWMATQV